MLDPYTKITIGDSDLCIYVNEQTHKGRQLISRSGMLHPKVTDVWRGAVTTFSPDLVLDIGCGYGDIMFSTEYNQSTRIIGLETNKSVEPLLKMSRSAHPNEKQIELKYSLDSLQTIQQQCRKLIFKMNLHGKEVKGCRALEMLINECDGVVGILDFNSIYLEDTGTKIEEFLTYLNTHFDVYILKSARKLIKLQPLNLPNLKRTLKKPYIITDLLLLSDPNLVTLLGYNKSINYLDRGQYYLKE